MDDLVLNIFSNSRKSKLSKKDFDEVSIRSSKKNISTTNKNIDSNISISKNIDEPKASDTFTNVMKGILDLSKRIQDKYTSSKKTPNSSNSGDRWKMDKIRQQKHEDDEGYNNKQDKSTGTSQKFLLNATYEPYYQRRSKSPPNSRVIVIPQNSRVVFQQTPQPSIPNYIINQNPQYNQHHHPIFISSPQPIIRKTIQQPKYITHPPPPPPSHIISYPPAPVIHHHPVLVPQPPPVFIRSTPIPQYRQPKAQIIRQPVILNQPTRSNPKYRPPYYQYYPGQKQVKLQQRPDNQSNFEQTKTKIQMTQPEITTEDNILAQELNKQPSKVNLTGQQLQKILEKQLKNNNNVNAQLLKQLRQLTQQQKKNKISPDILQTLKKNQKTIVKTKKVTKKTTSNKNSSTNSKSCTNQAMFMNQQSFMNMGNFQDFFNQQNYLPMLQYFYANNPQMLQDGTFVNGFPPGTQIGNIPQQNGSQKKLRAPLGQIRQNVQQEQKSSGRKAQKPLIQKRSKQSLDSQLITKQKQLNALIDNQMKKLQAVDQNYQVNNYINDLQQLKNSNSAEAKQFLNKFDEIIMKMQKGTIQSVNLQKKYFNKTQQQPQVYPYRSGQYQPSQSITENFFSKSKDFVYGIFDHFKN